MVAEVGAKTFLEQKREASNDNILEEIEPEELNIDKDLSLTVRIKGGSCCGYKHQAGRPSPATKPKPSAGNCCLSIIRAGADLLFQVISRRYEQGALVITSNRASKEWPEFFNDRVFFSSPESPENISANLIYQFECPPIIWLMQGLSNP